MSDNHTTRYPKVRYYRRKLKQSPPPKSPKEPFVKWLSSWFWWLFLRFVFTYFIFMLGYILGTQSGGKGLC